MFTAAKWRAALVGVPFTITLNDLTDLVRSTQVCPWLGIPVGRDAGQENTRSLDRIIPEHGYAPGNIIIISGRANRIKSDASAEELERIARGIRGAQYRAARSLNWEAHE